MEYIIWCDESVSKGKHYSDFYGGVLVQSIHLDEVKERLSQKKSELEMNQELKWSKMTSMYLEVYQGMMDEFFALIKEGKMKVRIMFRQTAHQAIVPQDNREKRFHLLYYQFIKHGFGFGFSNETDREIYLKPFFDKLPDTKEKNEEFKNHIYALQSLTNFSKANIKIRRDDIAEVDSRKHLELQCLDIVLGAMSFRLNDMHKEIPEGKKRRGKRTVAKEKLFKYISSYIREIYPGFNIGMSTGIQGEIKNRWLHSYRHWNFVPKDMIVNKENFK